MSPDVAVVVPSFERPDRLRRLIDALGRQTLPVEQWEVVVVDDGSRDETPSVLDELRTTSRIQFRALRTPDNGGPARARNLGWRATAAGFVAFTDDDCVPDPGWLAAGVAALRASRGTGIVQGRTMHADIAAGAHYTWRTVVREVPSPSPWFEGCNLFLRREALEAAGGFDERIGWFGEETSLGWQVLERGWRRGWEADAIVRHDVFDRPLRWHLRNRYLEGNLVALGVAHPTLRETWWRPWAISREGALFALATIGFVGAVRWRGALVLAAPYAVQIRRDSRGVPASITAFRVLCSATSLVGRAVASGRARSLVL